MKYTPTIGIECHVQLATKTKLFSAVDNDARDKAANSCVSPIDYALPGMLPVLNQEAVHLAIRAGLTMNCKINLTSRFDRKHYYYPDLPKGYQISQFYQPIIGPGKITLADNSTVRIEHAHLEEDAGKLTHFGDYSLVDLNRAGTPLLEIVSQPDIHSEQQARLYCEELWRLMTYTKVSHGDLYHGNMRFDVNISLSATDQLGTRAEIKNLNSFRSVQRAVEYEIKRQAELLEKGEKIKQETRGWSDAKGKTTAQRSKEQAQDYRYMPEPDIPPIVLDQDFVEKERTTLPLLPTDYRDKLKDIIPGTTLEILLNHQPLADKVIQLLSLSTPVITTKIVNLFTSVLLAEENHNLLEQPLPSTNNLLELAQMLENNELSSSAGKTIFLKLYNFEGDEKSPFALAKEMNLLQQNDSATLDNLIDQVLADPAATKAAADVRAGEQKALGFLVGQVMKHSHGQANPAIVAKILNQKLK